MTATEMLYRQEEAMARLGYHWHRMNDWQRQVYGRVALAIRRYELVERGTYTDDMRQMLADLKRNEAI